MNYELKPELEKILGKLKKKDSVAHKAILNKIEEIANSPDPDRYKPLRYGMKNKKSVHIVKSFVLVFEYDRQRQFLSFLDYDHHDNIYKKYR